MRKNDRIVKLIWLEATHWFSCIWPLIQLQFFWNSFIKLYQICCKRRAIERERLASMIKIHRHSDKLHKIVFGRLLWLLLAFNCVVWHRCFVWMVIQLSEKPPKAIISKAIAQFIFRLAVFLVGMYVCVCVLFLVCQREILWLPQYYLFAKQFQCFYTFLIRVLPLPPFAAINSI